MNKRKPVREKKSVITTIRLSLDEVAEIRRLTRHTDQTMGAYIREAVASKMKERTHGR